MRNFTQQAGAVNTRCAVEVGLDEMAEQMAVDPIDLRLANLLPPHSRTITGFRITSNGMREALEEVRNGSNWDKKFRQLLQLIFLKAFHPRKLYLTQFDFLEHGLLPHQ